MVWRNLLAVALLVFGCFQMVGHLVDAPALREIGAASAVAPLPRDFAAVEGHESFASGVVVLGVDRAGEAFGLTLGPETFAEVEGPAARRRVYARALSGAPRLPDAVWEAVWCHGLGETGPLRRELGLPDGSHSLSLQVRPRAETRKDVWLRSPSCTR